MSAYSSTADFDFAANTQPIRDNEAGVKALRGGLAVVTESQVSSGDMPTVAALGGMVHVVADE